MRVVGDQSLSIESHEKRRRLNRNQSVECHVPELVRRHQMRGNRGKLIKRVEAQHKLGKQRVLLVLNTNRRVVAARAIPSRDLRFNKIEGKKHRQKKTKNKTNHVSANVMRHDNHKQD